MEIRTIPIKWEGKDAIVKIKELTIGESNQAQREAMTIKMVNVGRTIQPQANLDIGILQESILLKSIIEAPWTVGQMDIVKNLPRSIGEKIYAEIEKLNDTSEEKKGNTEAPLETAPMTQ